MVFNVYSHLLNLCCRVVETRLGGGGAGMGGIKERRENGNRIGDLGNEERNDKL